MKALAVLAPGIARVVHLPEANPLPGECLLQVRMVGLCGSDLNTFRGKNPMVSYPRVLGHEVAATVVSPAGDFEIGTDVTLLPYTACGQCAACKAGRINTCRYNETLGVQRDGALCELISMSPEKLFRANLSLRELCLVEPLTVGFHAVSRARVTDSDMVAVFGCGGIGIGAIAGAAYRGAHVIAIDRDEQKLEIALQAGASSVIHSGKEDLRSRLAEITQGNGPQCVIEAVGLPETFRASVEEVAFAGRVVYIGYAKEEVSYETRLFVQKELDICGSRNALRTDFKQVIEMLEAKRFPVEKVISAVVSLDEAPDILRDWSENPEKYTKIMVRL